MKIRYPFGATFPSYMIGEVLAHEEGRCNPTNCPVHKLLRDAARREQSLAEELATSIRRKERA